MRGRKRVQHSPTGIGRGDPPLFSPSDGRGSRPPVASRKGRRAALQPPLCADPATSERAILGDLLRAPPSATSRARRPTGPPARAAAGENATPAHLPTVCMPWLRPRVAPDVRTGGSRWLCPWRALVFPNSGRRPPAPHLKSPTAAVQTASYLNCSRARVTVGRNLAAPVVTGKPATDGLEEGVDCRGVEQTLVSTVCCRADCSPHFLIPCWMV